VQPGPGYLLIGGGAAVPLQWRAAGVGLGFAKAGDEPRHNWLPNVANLARHLWRAFVYCSISGQVRALHFTAVVVEHEQPEHR
jgi:hypothetical protein